MPLQMAIPCSQSSRRNSVPMWPCGYFSRNHTSRHFTSRYSSYRVVKCPVVGSFTRRGSWMRCALGSNIAPPSPISEQMPEPALTVGDFAIEMGDTGFELGATLTVLRRDEVGEVFPEANGADDQRVREQEAAAVFLLHEDYELVVKVWINHAAPPARPCAGSPGHRRPWR